MSWINVLRQDPEEGQVYDVWTSSGERMIDLVWLKGKWINAENLSDTVDISATHFMPSPEPPKD